MTTGLRLLGCALLGVAAVMVASSLGGGAGSAKADVATVALTPPSQVVHMGENVTVDIEVSGVTDLAAWGVTIKYDPTVVSFGSYQRTDWMDSTGRHQSCPNAIITHYTDTFETAQFGCGSLASTPAGVDGSGVVAHATFTTNGEGTSNLELLSAGLALPLGDDCCGPVTTHEGAVQVVAAGAAETTPPPTPTPNPVKLTPTAIPQDPDQLTLPTGSRTTPTSGGSTPSAGSGSGPSGGSGSGNPGSGSGGSGVLGASQGLFSGNSSTGGGGTSASASGAPHAGEGTLRDQHSLAVRLSAGLLALAGVAFVGFAGLGFRRRNARRDD